MKNKWIMLKIASKSKTNEVNYLSEEFDDFHLSQISNVLYKDNRRGEVLNSLSDI